MFGHVKNYSGDEMKIILTSEGQQAEDRQNESLKFAIDMLMCRLLAFSTEEFFDMVSVFVEFRFVMCADVGRIDELANAFLNGQKEYLEGEHLIEFFRATGEEQRAIEILDLYIQKITQHISEEYMPSVVEFKLQLGDPMSLAINELEAKIESAKNFLIEIK